jgi:hypothetical protein
MINTTPIHITTSHILGLSNHLFDFRIVYILFSSTNICDQIYFLLWSINFDVLELSISNKSIKLGGIRFHFLKNS